jgi:hypothetical protein
MLYSMFGIEMNFEGGNSETIFINKNRILRTDGDG